MKIKLSHRILFWILLGATSTFFAEVISGSSPFIFFDAWGLRVVFPLYSLHILVLAGLAFKNGAPRFSTLFFAGMLFGLYEAYITKVLWQPPWGASISVLGVDLLAFGTLVPYWHNFLSFLIPLLVVELWATNSQVIFNALPSFVQSRLANPRWQIGLAIWFGIVESAAREPGQSLVSGVANLLVIVVLFLLWRRFSQRKYPLVDLVPKGRSFWVFAFLLAMFYIWAIPSILPERLPEFGAQLTILVIYLLVGLAFFASRRRPADIDSRPLAIKWRPVWTLIAAYLASTFLYGFLPPGLKIIAFAINGYGGMLVGLVALIYSLRHLRTAK